MTNQIQKELRLFFTDPIKVMYMIEHFDVNFTITNGTSDEREDDIGITNLADGSYAGAFSGKYFVKRESEEIFSPQEGDIVIVLNKIIGRYTPVRKKCIKGFFLNELENPVLGTQIIMRDNKQFFMPTKEEK